MKYNAIYDPVFCVKYNIYWKCQPKQWFEHVHQVVDSGVSPEDYDAYRAICVTSFPFVFLGLFQRKPCINTITHECTHAVLKMLAFKGVQYSCDSEEIYAYYLSWLVESVVDAVKVGIPITSDVYNINNTLVA